LLEAHEIIIREVHAGITLSANLNDWGTNDLLMSDVLRMNEKQVWFIAEHLVNAPLVIAEP
jgi:starvation-inducible DNA-binding protein